MARIRYLKPEFFTDEDLAELPLETRVTFAGIWCHADKAGRLEYRPKFLKAMIWPYDAVDMESQLQALSRKPFIRIYTIDGHRLIQIINWEKHQKPHHTEKESVLPPPPPKEEEKNLPAPSLKEEEREKGMEKGMEKQDEGSTRLRNGSVTVKKRLKSTEVYNCPYFQKFWNAYPKKEAKGKAWEEWKKIFPVPDQNFSVLVQKSICTYKQTEQWNKDSGKFIPLPASWLHGRRWDDEPCLNLLRGKVSEKTVRSINNLNEWMADMEEQDEKQKKVL